MRYEKRKSPPAATGGAQCLGQTFPERPENSPPALDIQALRAAFLARRGVAPELAPLIASIALGEVQA